MLAIPSIISQLSQSDFENVRIVTNSTLRQISDYLLLLDDDDDDHWNIHDQRSTAQNRQFRYKNSSKR